MNTTLRKFSVLILSGAILAACGDDDDAKNGSTNIEPEFPTEYSDKTVEQNKAELQDNGVALVDKFTTLKSSSGIQTSIAFSEYVDGTTVPNIGGRVASSPINLLEVLSSFGQGKTSASGVKDGMRTKADDFESFAKSYNDVIGVYTYNKTNDSWTYEKTGSQIVFKFPSTKTGTTNNAQYAIYDYKGTTISGSELGGDDYTGDYPTNLKADLTIDGTKKMEYSFSTAYDSKGTPTNITISIKIDSFTFLYALTNTTTEAKIDYSLSEGSNILFALGARGKGSFNVDDVADDASDVVADASAYFQIMNVKFSGETNATALRKALDAATTIEQKAAAYNANYQLIVFYADSKKKIADSEFYVGKRSYTYTDCYYSDTDVNGDGQVNWMDYVCEDVTETEDALEIRMVFADGSKSDLETYTEVGFKDLQDDLEDFINSFE